MEKVLLVSKTTGEIIENGYGVFTSFDELNKKKDAKQKRDKQNLERQEIKENYKNFGNFSWLLVNALEDNCDISSSDITRLMFMSTYLSYSNYIVFDNGKFIDKNNLRILLGLKESAFFNFIKVMIDKKYIEIKDEKIYMNKLLFFKGKNDNLINLNQRCTRLYHDGIRNLYKQCKVSSHKQLGYVFLLLPFSNIKYNLICKNVHETEIEKINHLTIGEVCDIIGYNRSHSNELKKMFSQCKFIDGKGAVGMVYKDGGVENWKLFINPKIYYGGNNHKEVEVLGGF